MLTNFVDTNGNEQDDSGILVSFDLHAVSIMEMKTFLVDFRYLDEIEGNRTRFGEEQRTLTL